MRRPVFKIRYICYYSLYYQISQSLLVESPRVLEDFCNRDVLRSPATVGLVPAQVMLSHRILGGRMMPSQTRLKMPHPVCASINKGQAQLDCDRTFHDKNDSGSIMVVCAISCPGKTPQVTAFRVSSVRFVRTWPYRKKSGVDECFLTNALTSLLAANQCTTAPSCFARCSIKSTSSPSQKNSTKPF